MSHWQSSEGESNKSRRRRKFNRFTWSCLLFSYVNLPMTLNHQWKAWFTFILLLRLAVAEKCVCCVRVRCVYHSRSLRSLARWRVLLFKGWMFHCISFMRGQRLSCTFSLSFSSQQQLPPAIASSEGKTTSTSLIALFVINNCLTDEPSAWLYSLVSLSLSTLFTRVYIYTGNRCTWDSNSRGNILTSIWRIIQNTEYRIQLPFPLSLSLSLPLSLFLLLSREQINPLKQLTWKQ